MVEDCMERNFKQFTHTVIFTDHSVVQCGTERAFSSAGILCIRIRLSDGVLDDVLSMYYCFQSPNKVM
jgi:hypothetical protein